MTGVAGLAVIWLVAIVCVGGWMDLKYRRLPNWLCAIAFLSGISVVAAVIGWDGVPSGLLHAAIALGIGMGLFALGGIGAGDAKFYAALAAWFPLRDGVILFTIVALAGIALLIAWFTCRSPRRGADRRRSADDPFGKLPYGIAIAAGALITFVLTHWPMLTSI